MILDAEAAGVRFDSGGKRQVILSLLARTGVDGIAVEAWRHVPVFGQRVPTDRLPFVRTASDGLGDVGDVVVQEGGLSIRLSVRDPQAAELACDEVLWRISQEYPSWMVKCFAAGAEESPTWDGTSRIVLRRRLSLLQEKVVQTVFTVVLEVLDGRNEPDMRLWWLVDDDGAYRLRLSRGCHYVEIGRAGCPEPELYGRPEVVGVNIRSNCRCPGDPECNRYLVVRPDGVVWVYGLGDRWRPRVEYDTAGSIADLQEVIRAEIHSALTSGGAAPVSRPVLHEVVAEPVGLMPSHLKEGYLRQFMVTRGS